MNLRELFIALFCCLLWPRPSVAQQLTREEITSAYIYNFAKNIEWKKEAGLSEFHFLLISDDKAVNGEMSNLSASRKLKGKPIRVTVSESAEVPGGVQLIFISRGKQGLGASVFRRIEGRNILLVTEGAEDKRTAMINLLDTEKKTIKFEINKANIINQGLKVLPDMVLLGGTEIDVAKLYKETQDTLRSKDVKIANLRQHLDSLGEQIAMSRKVIDRQELLIASQSRDILGQQDQLGKQRDTLSRQARTLAESQRRLEQHQVDLRRQEEELEAGKSILAGQQERIDKQNASIARQKRVLERQNLTIATQELVQRFLILVIVLVAMLAYSLYRSYVGKKHANRLLGEQKDRLQAMLGQLKQARDRAQQYLDIAGVILVAVDTGRRITMLNRKGCDVLGWPGEEVIARDWFESFVPENARGDQVRRFQRFIEGDAEAVESYESMVLTRGRGERLIAWQNALLRDENGAVIGTLGSGEDITDKKRIERRIEKLNRDLQDRAAALEAANRELEAFSYSVSHDLRAPLRSIDGFSQAILEDYEDAVDARGKDYLRRVRSAAQRMAGLIDDMLKLSRVVRGDMVRRDLDLGAMATEIADRLRKSQPERKAEFVVGRGLTARGDEHLLRIVLENLLDNAWKYTSRHPAARIEFGSRETGRERAFFVRDDGAGFDMKYAQKLFGAFQRMHTTEEFSGTGVGLATVQRIIRRHGGRIWAESEVEKGATFYFTLPDKESENGESEVDPAG